MKSLLPPYTDEVQTLTRYLLGQLPESEREAIEQRSVTEPRLSDTLAAIETELIDAWARGELGPEERRRVEEILLASPAQRERVRTARAIAARDARPHRWWLAAAAAILVVAGASWFLMPRQTSSPTIANIDRPAPAPAAAVVTPTLTFAAGLTRSADATPKLLMTKNAGAVRLVVELLPGDDEYESYTARVQTISGALIRELRDLHVSRDGGVPSVIVVVPPLAEGRHELLLEADGELIAQHVFDVAM
jgi:hypothetical protein